MIKHIKLLFSKPDVKRFLFIAALILFAGLVLSLVLDHAEDRATEKQNLRDARALDAEIESERIMKQAEIKKQILIAEYAEESRLARVAQRLAADRKKPITEERIEQYIYSSGEKRKQEIEKVLSLANELRADAIKNK